MKKTELKTIIQEELKHILNENAYLNKAELNLMNAKISYIKALIKLQKQHPDKVQELKKLKSEFESSYNELNAILNKVDDIVGNDSNNSSPVSQFKFS